MTNYQAEKDFLAKYRTFLENIRDGKLTDIDQILNFINKSPFSLFERQFEYEHSLLPRDLQDIVSEDSQYSDIFQLEEKVFEEADVTGGSEGAGEYYREVVKIIPLGLFIAHTGTYYSYDGVSYLGQFYEVEYKQVTTWEYV